MAVCVKATKAGGLEVVSTSTRSIKFHQSKGEDIWVDVSASILGPPDALRIPNDFQPLNVLVA